MVVRPTIVGRSIVVATLLLAAPLAVEAQPTGPAVHTVGVLAAYTGEAEHRDRSMVNAPIGDRDRSEATLVGRSAVELALLSP
jgi:hypothetical protein